MHHVERRLAVEPVVLLSFAELTLDGDADGAQPERVVALTAGITNETPVETARLPHRGLRARPARAGAWSKHLIGTASIFCYICNQRVILAARAFPVRITGRPKAQRAGPTAGPTAGAQPAESLRDA